MNRRVVITGIGAVTPLGHDANETWNGLAEGRSGVTTLNTFDASTFDVRIAGMVNDYEIDARVSRADARRLSRAASFMVGAALEALDDAGDLSGVPPYSKATVIAGTVGRPALVEMVDMASVLNHSAMHTIPRQVPSLVQVREQSVATSIIGSMSSLFGPSINVSTACAGAAHAICEGYDLVQSGEVEVAVAGGFDALTTWMDVIGFSLLGALNDTSNESPETASRPFDRDRDGFVLGEGAVSVVLESLDSALGRGAEILAEIKGCATTLNAYRITDSPPDGTGPAEAMAAAIKDSGLCPYDIDLVVAHGTGTPGNDASETKAIKTVFQGHAKELLITSPKSMAGHLTSAAAGVNLIAALGAIRWGIVPPTINLDNPDPELDLDYVPLIARENNVRHALINAFAFGGTNACIVISDFDSEKIPKR